MVKSNRRFSFVRFTEPITLIQTEEVVLSLKAEDGWLMCDDSPGWLCIRRWFDGHFQDRGATWVELSRLAETSRLKFVAWKKFRKKPPCRHRYALNPRLRKSRADHLYSEIYLW